MLTFTEFTTCRRTKAIGSFLLSRSIVILEKTLTISKFSLTSEYDVKLSIFLDIYTISRPTKYLLDWGKLLTATITSEHYRKFLLFQGRLKIPCVITVTMIATVRGHLLLQRCEQFVKTLYAEPKDKVIVGSYLTKTNFLPSSMQMTGFVQRRRKRTQRTRWKAKTSVSC